MREIKFRGRRLDNGKWVTGDLLHGKNGKVLINAGTKMFTNYAEIDPNTVGQFTGLLDKNGKEIYEGDIVEMGKYTGEVRWMPGKCCFQLSPGGVFLSRNCTVLGNIYDHPELTKAPKQ